MPAHNRYAKYITPPTMQHAQPTVAHGHKVVCAQHPQSYGPTMSINSGFGGSVGSIAPSYSPAISTVYSPGCPSSSGNPPALRPNACIPLPPLSQLIAGINPLLERGTTPQIKYDIHLPPSSVTSRRHLVDDDRWRYEQASNPNVGSLTIRMALVSKPIVVFPASVDDEMVTVQDVFLAVHYALRASTLDDHHSRRKHRRGELWSQGAAKSYRTQDDYKTVGCYTWAGLTRSPTEGDVWILMTT